MNFKTGPLLSDPIKDATFRANSTSERCIQNFNLKRQRKITIWGT